LGQCGEWSDRRGAASNEAVRYHRNHRSLHRCSRSLHFSVITKLAILAARKPKCQHVAFLGCRSYEHVLQTMQLARSELLEIVSAIEFLDRASLELVVKHIPSQSMRVMRRTCATCASRSRMALTCARVAVLILPLLTLRCARSPRRAASLLRAARDLRR
jgi:hypothetical protein